jgi:hypothetical protein
MGRFFIDFFVEFRLNFASKFVGSARKQLPMGKKEKKIGFILNLFGIL